MRPAPSLMHRVQRIHLIGMGGAGMSGIAEVLLNLGFEVSGSDQAESDVLTRLSAMGATVHHGHKAEHQRHADVVVVSGAVAEDNPEVVAAQQRRIPVVPRAEMLGELMRFRHGIAVAGTHGKTTTTSMIASILAAAGMDPTFVVGGLLHAYGANGRLGEGRYLVAEADESDASFLKLQPVISVITNIDRDHLDAYHGSFDQLQASFLAFIHHLPFFGVAVMCLDDPHVAELLPRVGRTVLTYGLNDQADVSAKGLNQSGQSMAFDLLLPDEDRAWPVRIQQPGRHNVLNALGAAAVAWELGVSASDIVAGLGGFEGVGRRFECIGTLDIHGHEVLAYEDYGHHPTELDAVLQTARAGWPDRRLVLVFQPHRYSRTRDQFDAFARVLADADVLVLADIYAAGEPALAGIHSNALAAAIAQRETLDIHRVAGIDEVPRLLETLCKDGDLLLVMGAGDVGRLGRTLRQQYGKEQKA